MRHLIKIITVTCGLFLVSCASGTRSPFAPVSAPPTVGMPAALNDRERLFVGDLEGALQQHGLVPVRHGAGDMSLEFAMDAGPINTDTRIALMDGRRQIARGTGRASGVPLVGRSTVAERSFNKAFEQFQNNLERAAERKRWQRPE